MAVIRVYNSEQYDSFEEAHKDGATYPLSTEKVESINDTIILNSALKVAGECLIGDKHVLEWGVVRDE